MLKTALLAAYAITATPTIAFAYCSEPDAPYCASSYSDFADEYEFKRCKNDMEYYASEVEDYTQCLANELETLRQEYENAAAEAARNADDVIEDYNDAVESFNRRAS